MNSLGHPGAPPALPGRNALVAGDQVGFDSVLRGLAKEYTDLRAHVEAIARFVATREDAMAYFRASALKQSISLRGERYFDRDEALRALDADFWNRTFVAFGIDALLPAEQLNEWKDLIKRHATPTYDLAIVPMQVRAWLDQREEYFRQKVEGLWRALSSHHATNSASGFRQRLIFRDQSAYGISLEFARQFHDLRSVANLLLGQPVLDWVVTHRALLAIEAHSSFGEWIEFDGGAFAVRLHKKKTAHVQLGKILAHRMNQVLGWKTAGKLPEFVTTQRAEFGSDMNLPAPVLSSAATNALLQGLAASEPIVAPDNMAAVEIGRWLTAVKADAEQIGEHAWRISDSEARPELAFELSTYRSMASRADG